MTPSDERDWWRQAVVYQVYPRSFADSNADGIGDIAGVVQRLDHLEALGVDAVWLSPFYPSALADGGYDVDDYRDVAPELGTLDDVDSLIAGLHRRGMRLIIDIVPNHSSDRHAWFREAIERGAGSTARSRYHFRDGRGRGGEEPPNDWQSLFGGPAWTRVADGQWYLHLFTPRQPDWNWDHADVREDFLRTLAFWGDRGVDGFRVDVAMMLAKDMSTPFPTWEQVSANLPAPMGPGGPSAFGDGRHPILDRDELDEIYRGWREVFDRYDPPLFGVAETWVEPHRRTRYADPRALGQAFNFDLLWSAWDASVFRRVVAENLAFAREAGSTSTWVLSNHDVVRPVTRYAPSEVPVEHRIMAAPELDAGQLAVGARRARAASMLIFALPGSAYVYQGEELGLPEVTGIPEDSRQDPQAKMVDGVLSTRDGCRVPIPWEMSGPSHGFGEAGAHLPQPEWFGEMAVARQEDDPDSSLTLFRRALVARRRLTADEDLSWLDLGEEVVAFERSGGWRSVTNFGEQPVALPPGRVELCSGELTSDGALPQDTTAWVLAPSEH